MTPLMVQDFLIKELTTLFAGKTLKNEKGEQAPFLICRQWLPAQDTDATVFPFIRVMLYYGKDPNDEDPYLCHIRLEIGTWDDDSTCQGHVDLMNAISTIYRHFMQQRYFDGKYELVYPLRWMVKPESTYPKFYGMMKLRWNIPKITISDILT